MAVIAIEPEDLESLTAALLLVGAAVGASERAEELVRYCRDKVDAVKEATAGATNRPRVYLAGSELLRTCGREMYQHSVIELAGGTNVSADIETGHWANVSLEQVLAWDPEVILLADYSDATVSQLAEDERWRGVTAVRNQRVYLFPSLLEPWDSPGPSAVLGVLWLAGTLQPTACSRAELEGDVQYFYRQYYGVDIPPESFGL